MFEQEGGFPKHLINPKDKDKSWVTQYIKAAWDDFGRIAKDSFHNGSDKYATIRSYMNGKQSVTKYQTSVTSGKYDLNSNESDWNIDWAVLGVVKKFRNIASEKIKKQGFRVSVDAVDQLAMTDRDGKFKELASKITLRDELAGQGIDPSLIAIDDENLRNLEELKIYMEHNYKHRLSIEMEQALDLVQKRNHFDEIEDELRLDLHDYGFAGVEEVIGSSGEIEIDQFKPRDIVVGYSEKKDFSDAPYKGRVKYMTIGDLKEQAGDDIPPSAYEEIAGKYSNKLDNRGQFGTNPDRTKVKVLKLEFTSHNEIVTEERTDRRGNKIKGRADYDRAKRSKNKKYKATPYKVVYEGSWIIETDYSFGCGLQSNQKRKKRNKKEVTGSIHLRAIELEDMIPQGIGETLIPIADQIQIAWYKLQQAILTARPKGVSINWDSVVNVSLGGGGGKITEEELLSLYNRSGSLLYSMYDRDGKQLASKPIEELVNGIGEEADRWYSVIRTHIQLLRDIYGFNEITDGSTPNERTLNGVANLAAESTINALSHIANAEKKLVESVYDGLSMRIQRVLKSGNKIEGYINAIGKNSVEFFSANKELSLYDFGMFIEERPTDEQIQRLREDISLALKTGEITIADKIAVEDLVDTNLKQAESILSYRIRRNKEEAQAEQERAVQQNAEVQQQSAITTAEQERETMQAEYKFKAELLQLEKSLELENLKEEWRLRAAVERISSGSKENQKVIETESREYQSDKTDKLQRDLAENNDKEKQPQ